MNRDSIIRRTSSHHRPHSLLMGSHHKRQTSQVRPETSTADSSDEVGDSTAEDPTPISTPPQPLASTASSIAPHPAKNHTTTSATPKTIKPNTKNLNTTSTTPPSKVRQTSNSNNKHSSTSSTTSGKSAETGVGSPETNLLTNHHTAQTLSSFKIYTIIGGGILLLAVLGLGIWGCCSRKQKREERRRSTWRTRAPGNIPYEYGDSAFGPHLEKLNSSDAKVLNSVHGTRLRGESVSKKSKLGNRSRSSQTRESELWGSGEDLGASSYVMPDPYKEREKSLYEDLDFGPAVMSSLADPHPAVPSLPPIAHLSEPGRRISVHGVNGLGPNGWERTNIMTDENQSLDRNPSLTRVKNKPTLSKSKTTSDKNHARKIPKPHLATSSSMNQLDEVSEREFDREQLRRKKDTIAGLTEAYGNANGWGEVELDPMPPDLYALQSYTLQNPSTHTSDHPIKSNPVARSKTLAAQNINLDPLSPAPHQPGSDSSLMQPTMRLSQASKELEEMVKFPYHEHPHPSNHSPTPLYPQDSSAMGMARSVSPFDHTFSPSSFHPSPQLGYFPPLPIPPSTTPKILGHTNGTFVEPPTRAPSVYSQSGHVSNYTAPISHPAGLTPGQHSAHPPDTHLRKKESQWQEAVMTHPGFGVSQAVQAKPTFSLPDLKHDPNSPRFTDLFPDFQSQPSPDPFSGPCLRSDPLIRSDSRNRDELDPKETKTIHQSGHSHQDAYHGIQSYPLQEFLNSDPNQKEFPSLSQMNVERLNQDYHSPTYSIYGMYNSPTQQTKV